MDKNTLYKETKTKALKIIQNEIEIQTIYFNKSIGFLRNCLLTKENTANTKERHNTSLDTKHPLIICGKFSFIKKLNWSASYKSSGGLAVFNRKRSRAECISFNGLVNNTVTRLNSQRHYGKLWRFMVKGLWMRLFKNTERRVKNRSKRILRMQMWRELFYGHLNKG